MRKFVVFLSMLIFGAGAVYALPPVTAGYGLVWSDEFDGPTLDTTSWSFDTGAGQNGEQEFYSQGNYTMDSGALTLRAKYNPNGVLNAASAANAKYTSGRVNTGGKKEFKYGYFEVRMRAPQGNGLWPAVWIIGASINHGVPWPKCGEMELYEARTGPQNEANPCPEASVPTVAGDNCFIATCHYANADGSANYNCGQRDYPKCLCDGYHTYGMLWDSLHVEHYFDDTLFWGPNFPTDDPPPSINQATNEVAFHSPFYWILNIAVGGAYQGGNVTNSIFPQRMDIDYVRVYQKGATGIVDRAVKHQTLRSFALVNPSTAKVRVYDLCGKLVADYSSKVRQMKTGDDVMKVVPSTLSNGAYVLLLTDNGLSTARKLVTAR